MGRLGAPLVADALEGCPGGSVAGGEHAFRPGLLTQRWDATV